MFKPDPKPEKRLREKPEERKKRYTCTVCKEQYRMTPTAYALRRNTKSHQTCGSVDCLTAKALKFLDDKRKADAKVAKQAAKAKKEKMKQSIMTLTDWKAELQKPVNWIVKELDKGLPCISHPSIRNFLRWDAGHYHGRGAHPELSFNLHNIHKQSSEANERYGGCPAFLAGLNARYGKEYADYVQYDLIRIYQHIGKEKLTIDNIKNIYLPNARKVKSEMQKGAKFTRDQVNELIGIYL